MAASNVLLVLCVGIALFAGCEKAVKLPLPHETTASVVNEILPVSVGEGWVYRVEYEMPGQHGQDPATREGTRVRRYVGKVSPVAGGPQYDCFEVVEEGRTTQREYVELTQDKVWMKGSQTMSEPPGEAMILEAPVLFAELGMKAGSPVSRVEAGKENVRRAFEVVAREGLDVPAGHFECLRMLMTGSDAGSEVRRTIWFAEGQGIVREEKTRYLAGKVVFRETQELLEIEPGQ